MTKRTSMKLLSLLIAAVFFVSGAQLQKAKAATGDYFNGPDNGWKINSAELLRNSKNYTYFYLNNEAKLSAYVTNAIPLWGASVSVRKGTAETADLCFNAEYKGDSVNLLSRKLTARNGSIVTAEIHINLSKFESLSNQAKTNVLAYAIGLAFGLDICSDPQSLMSINYATSKTATASDKMGMKVATGVHTNHTFGSFSFENTTYHKRSCSYCQGIQHQHHISVTGGSTCRICGYNGPITASLLE